MGCIFLIHQIMFSQFMNAWSCEFYILKRMGSSKNGKPYVCKSCVEGEHAKKPFINKTDSQSKEFIDMDLCLWQ